MIMIPSLISSPALFIVVLALTGIYFKEAVVIGAILGLIIFSFQYIAARKIKTYKYLEGVYSEKRLRIISDIINGIRTIKVYAWEIPFSKLVNKFRTEMIKILFKNVLIESIMRGIGFTGGYIIGLPIFGYHYILGRKFDYNDSLAIISILGASSLLIFKHFYLALSTLSNFLAILKRIGEVLDMEEFNVNEDSKVEVKADEESKYSTEDFEFDSENPQLIAVTGIVGSGKSTLLSLLISKVLKKNKQTNSNTTIAYVEQEPFIVSGTIKNNILFGLDYNEERMNKVIEVCCLEHDLEIFNKGLDTEIGDKGINASGGQKARISLARA